MQDVAIIGMACKLPHINNLEDFYKRLSGMQHHGSSNDPETHSFTSNWGEAFDNKFFFISDEDAKIIDPQQKIFLAVAYWALDDSLLASGGIPENTGVYVGASSHEFALKKHADNDLSHMKLSSVGSNFIANRVSNFFNFSGPSFAVDAACTSSVVAIKLASEALRSGEIDLAIAGGVHIKNSGQVERYFLHNGLVSKTGHCFPLSSRAEGYVRGEGAGAVVLKRLEDALEHGDRIYAVIKNAGVVHSGTSLNILSPNLKSQLALYDNVYKRAGVSPATVDYLESSAGGLLLADKIEFKGITQYFGSAERSGPLRVGANKHLFGNLEAASSIISLIKLGLILYKNRVPSQSIEGGFTDNLLQINYPEQTLADDPDAGYAALNSFGLGGLNSHLVLQRSTSKTIYTRENKAGQHCFLISAKSKEALHLLLVEYLVLLEKGCDSYLAWCDLVSSRKSRMRFRMAVLFSTKSELITALQNYLQGSHGDNVWGGDVRHEPLPTFIVNDPVSFFSNSFNDLVDTRELTFFWQKSRSGLECVLQAELPQNFTDFINASTNVELPHLVMLYRLVKTFMSDKLFQRAFPLQSDIINCLENDITLKLDSGEVIKAFADANRASCVELIPTQAGQVAVKFELQAHDSFRAVQAQLFCLGLDVKYPCRPVPSQILDWLPNYPLFQDIPGVNNE